MLLPFLAVLFGLLLLVWSADRFVEGAARTARYFGMPPLLIGMVIVGFGTSAPEMVVSLFAALGGNAGIALGNAYGSNITNIGLILGSTALVRPIGVSSQVLRKELPILTGITVLAVLQLRDATLSRLDAMVLLLVFSGLMAWTVREGLRRRADAFGEQIKEELAADSMPIGRALFWLLAGLVLLVLSSRLLVWGAVAIARGAGVSDLLIGLTIVAVGTSLPEFASSLAAARKGEHDIALGNILGSNLFNTLAVVGLAGSVRELAIPAEVLSRDLPVMAGLTVSLFVIGYGFRGPGRINRFEGAALLLAYLGYTGFLALGAVGP